MLSGAPIYSPVAGVVAHVGQFFRLWSPGGSRAWVSVARKRASPGMTFSVCCRVPLRSMFSASTTPRQACCGRNLSWARLRRWLRQPHVHVRFSTRHEGVSSRSGWDLSDAADFTGGDLGSEALGALLVLGDWMMTPLPRKPSRVIVPDVRGLFYSVCTGITGKVGLRVTTVRLTEHPMPVDGLVVDQSPRPAVQTRWGSALTVHVWHPPARSADPRRITS
jgi:hypothetical protein